MSLLTYILVIIEPESRSFLLSNLLFISTNTHIFQVSLGNRCRWGMRNGLFYVAKDIDGEDKEKVLGVAMWMPPRPAGQKEGWSEWFDNWRLYFQQVSMNLWYGRGGLNVKVRDPPSGALKPISIAILLYIS